MWFTMLHNITDNLNRITDPTNFSITTSALSEMVNVLVNSDGRRLNQSGKQTNLIRNVTLYS